MQLCTLAKALLVPFVLWVKIKLFQIFSCKLSRVLALYSNTSIDNCRLVYWSGWNGHSLIYGKAYILVWG